MTSKSKVDVKREFDAFAAKVARLESLRQQFESLDTHGFEREAKSIKAKLTNVNAINQLSKEIEELRRKIGTHHKSGEESKKQHAKMMALSQYLERKTEDMRGKIAELEKKLAEKKKVSVKKQLNTQEMEYVHDIPKLEHELRSLNLMLAEHLKSKKVKIDAGVGLMVDAKFDDFILGIKSELSERLKQKEGLMTAELKDDFQQREKIFADKYRKLVEEFHDRYKQKVHDDLKNEVKKHFDKDLKDKLAIERHKLVDSLVRENAAKLHKDKKKLVDSLENQYTEKEQKLAQHLHGVYAKNMKVLKSQVSSKMSVLKGQAESLRTRERSLQAKRSEIVKDLNNKRQHLDSKTASARKKLEDREKEIDRVTGNLNKQHEGMQRQKAYELKQLEDERRRLHAKVSAEKEALKIKHESFVRHKNHELSIAENELRKAVHERQAALREKDKKRQKQLLKKERQLTENKEKLRDEHIKLQEEKRKVLDKVEKEKKTLVLRQAKALQARKQALEQAVQRRMRQLSKVSRKIKMQSIAHNKDKMRQLAVLRNEEADFSQQRKIKFNMLEQEHSNLTKERKELHDRFNALQQHERREVENHKKRLSEQVGRHIKDNDEMFDKKVEVFKLQMHSELKRKINAVKRSNAAVIAQEVRKKEVLLREQIKREYIEKMKRESARHEIALQRKKEILERHVMEHLKQALS